MTHKRGTLGKLGGFLSEEFHSVTFTGGKYAESML
jgi:hypothetical protein